MISVPVMENEKIRYISIPAGYRMWTKEETKLEIATDLIRLAMQAIGTEKSVVLCYDSWYPKSEIKELPDEFENMDIICNVRCDTALYALPPEHNGKRGRPRLRGERISLNDFVLQEIEKTGYRAGGQKVMTRLFGKHAVHAVVTESKSGSRRLFLCTKSPQELHFDTNCTDIGKAAEYGKTDVSLLPLTIYALRWHIETAFYEQKKFWSLGSYMLRSRNGIECLLTVLYSMMTLLPFLDSDFSFLSCKSPQQSRFLLSCCLHQELFFATFGRRPKTAKNISVRNSSHSLQSISA